MNVLVNITRQTLHKHTLYQPEDRSIHILYICLDKLTIYDGINYLPSPPPAHYHNCLYCLIEPYPQAISLHVRLFIYVCLRVIAHVRVCVCLFVLYRLRFRLAALTLTPEEQTAAIFAMGFT